jgi:hypothetical protein
MFTTVVATGFIWARDRYFQGILNILNLLPYCDKKQLVIYKTTRGHFLREFNYCYRNNH